MPARPQPANPNTGPTQAFALELRQLRGAASNSPSVAEISNAYQISRATIYGVLAGKRNCTPQTLRALVSAWAGVESLPQWEARHREFYERRAWDDIQQPPLTPQATRLAEMLQSILNDSPFYWKDVSNRTGIPAYAINNYLMGYMIPGIMTLEVILDSLQVRDLSARQRVARQAERARAAEEAQKGTG